MNPPILWFVTIYLTRGQCSDIMNIAPAHSAGRSSSDFSIERILSDEPVKKEQSEVPGWLCCTRYHPPRLPRAVSGSRSRRSGRHARVPFTAAQAAALEAAYARAPYLAPPALRALAAALQLRDDRIKIWFQNRRARERREKSSTILPPHDITLPPTVIDNQGILVTASRTWITREEHITNNEVTNTLPENYVNKMDALTRNTIQPTSFTSVLNSAEKNNPLDVETIED